MKTLFDSSKLYMEQIDINVIFENLLISSEDNTCISTIYEMLYNDKKENYRNIMVDTIKNQVEYISEFVFINSTKQSSDKKKFKSVLTKLHETTLDINNFWEPIRKSVDEVNIFSSIETKQRKMPSKL